MQSESCICIGPSPARRYLCPISRIRNVRSSSIIEAAEASEMETEIGFLNRQVWESNATGNRTYILWGL